MHQVRVHCTPDSQSAMHFVRTLCMALDRMAKTLYCWRCKMEVPMLDAQEWERVDAALTNSVQAIKTYRETHNVPLSQAKTETFWEALALYREITGFPETNPQALWHHRIELYGPPCHVCGKSLRTPIAKRCFECGEVRSNKTMEPTQ